MIPIFLFITTPFIKSLNKFMHCESRVKPDSFSFGLTCKNLKMGRLEAVHNRRRPKMPQLTEKHDLFSSTESFLPAQYLLLNLKCALRQSSWCHRMKGYVFLEGNNMRRQWRWKKDEKECKKYWGEREKTWKHWRKLLTLFKTLIILNSNFMNLEWRAHENTNT